jgi:peptide/nickel transport system ATP-binding protein
MIEISHVTHAFGRRRGVRGGGLTVLEDVTLSIPDGGFVAFLGPSGCGKTSLLRMLDGLLMPSSGTITVDGKRVTGPSADRAIVFQEFNLFPWRAAQRNIEFPLEVQGAGREAYRRKAGETLGLVGLDQFGGFYPHQLSGGMKQRTVTIISTLLNPRLLVADEPTSALDVSSQKVLIEMLQDMLDKRIMAGVIFITHDLPVLRTVATHIAVMYQGRVVEKGPTDIIVNHPQHPYTQALMSSVLVPEPKYSKMRIEGMRDFNRDDFEAEAVIHA